MPHVLSCYAPTFVACQEEKNKFFDPLQDALSSIPPGESFVLMGDLQLSKVSAQVARIKKWM